MKEKKLLKIQPLPKVLRVQAIRSKQLRNMYNWYIHAYIILGLSSLHTYAVQNEPAPTTQTDSESEITNKTQNQNSSKAQNQNNCTTQNQNTGKTQNQNTGKTQDQNTGMLWAMIEYAYICMCGMYKWCMHACKCVYPYAYMHICMCKFTSDALHSELMRVFIRMHACIITAHMHAHWQCIHAHIRTTLGHTAQIQTRWTLVKCWS